MKPPLVANYLILCAAAATLSAQATTLPESSTSVALDNPKASGAKEQQQLATQAAGYQQQPTNPMSCYVCSNMDFDDKENNACRTMRAHHRHKHTSMISFSPATTTTAKVPTSTPTSTSTSTSSLASTFSSASSEPSASHAASVEEGAWLGSTEAASETTRHANQSQPAQPSAQAQLSGQTPVQLSYPTSHLSPIKTRLCGLDENFCSIVQVVRIEFINDHVVSRFWAMERNCSKSCNTGCMLIGERVRLRVCSQCCRTPNCNTGNGALSLSATRAARWQQLQLSVGLTICWLLIKLQQRYD